MMRRVFGHEQPAVYLQHLPYLTSIAIAVQSFTVAPEAVSTPASVATPPSFSVTV
jgi:hypothetical protein